MKRTKFFLLIILLFFFYSCNVSSTESETKELLTTLWKLESFETNGEVVIPPKEQIYNIQFIADSTLIGQSDCNEIFGYFVAKSNFIELDSLFTTEKGCGDSSMGSIYFDALRLAKSFKIDRNKLTIYYKTDSKLIFKGD